MKHRTGHGVGRAEHEHEQAVLDRYLKLAADVRSTQRGIWRWHTSLHLPQALPSPCRNEVHKRQVRGFKGWLRERRDRVRPMLGWLEQGVADAVREELTDHVSDDSSKPRFIVEPNDLVFIEKAGITYGGNGHPPHEWP